MTKKTTFLGLVLLIMFGCQFTHSGTFSDVSQATQNDDLPPIIDSLKNQITKLGSKQKFIVDRTFDDQVEGKLPKLNKAQIDFFYSTEKWKSYREYFDFTSYFYGYSTDMDGITKVYILNSNFEYAIYIDCFIMNKSGKVVDMFRPAFLELSNDYSYSARGEFSNDSVYFFLCESTKEIDAQKNVGLIDTLKLQYTISKSGLLIDTLSRQNPDTLYNFYDSE